MRATLELDNMTVPEVNASYRSLIQMLRNLDPHVQFEIANSIWYKRGYTIERPFLDANRTYYDAQVTALDFASPTAPVTINDWVSAQTHGLIDHIIDPLRAARKPVRDHPVPGRDPAPAGELSE
jgi:serine protease inhibitor